MTRLRIATRGSTLARWQADHVVALLHKAGPPVEAEIVVVETSGDRRLDVPIWELGGKGVFVKEVQAAVLDGRADVAVHSAKDLPSSTPDGLVIAAVPERGDVRDALRDLFERGPAPELIVALSSRRALVKIPPPDSMEATTLSAAITRTSTVPPCSTVVTIDVWPGNEPEACKVPPLKTEASAISGVTTSMSTR